MSLLKFVFLVLFVYLADAAYAQPLSDTAIVRLSVDENFPLQVILTEKLRFKDDEVVSGKILEPVYAFDREVIPSGTDVVGRVTGFRKAGKWKRVFSMLAGDFTPLREPQITFDTLILSSGIRIPIHTAVVAGAGKLVRSDGIGDESEPDLKSALTSTVKEPRKERLKKFLWKLAPYRSQSLPVGTHLQAVLLTPLDFGAALFRAEELDAIGSQPPAGSIISARLVTALDSHTTNDGAPVEALLTHPLFSSDHRLIFPVGSRLRGEVLDVSAARKLHRNAELAFTFTTIEPPLWMASGTFPVQDIEGRLVGVQVARDMDDVRINHEGETRVSESAKRFIAPAYAVVKAGRAINDNADPFSVALTGAYSGKATKLIGGNNPGLGLAGSISGAMVPPVGIGLGFYSAARSIYSNIIGRGQEIHFPANTSIEIRLDAVGSQP